MSRERPRPRPQRLVIQLLLLAALVAVCPAGGPQTAYSAPERRADEPLAVLFERPSRVFGSQEIVRFTATVALRKPEAREPLGRLHTPRLEWQLVPHGDTKAIAAGEARIPGDDGNSVDVDVEFLLPKQDGVYCLKLTALGRRVPRAERELQLVVVAAERPAPAVSAENQSKLVDSFDPASGGLFRRLSLDTSGKKPVPVVSRLLKSPRQNGDSPQSLASLNAVAYRLKVVHPGRPHLVELICRPDLEQSGSLCLIEEGGHGQYFQLGPECLFVVGPHPSARKSRSNPAPEEHIHRQLFWPNDREPGLVIAGRAGGRPLEFSRVQVYEMGDHLAATDHWPSRPDAGDSTAGTRPRLVGASLNLADLACNFCGPRTTAPGHAGDGDDWQTYQAAGLRLVEFLRYQQQNALLLGVSASADELACGTDEQPSGTGPTSGDVLEFLFRLFDREGLVLIPELRFETPLTAMENAHGEGADPVIDPRLVDGSGRVHPFSQAGTPDGAAHYNPLSSRVQEAVQDVVAGFLRRYSSHSSLGGLAFRLGRRSYLQLPGLEWGYDTESICRFEQSTPVRVPRDRVAPGQAYQFLTTTARREWVRYRAAEIAAFHRRLVEHIVDVRPDARVIFSGQDPSGDEANASSELVGFIRAGTNPARMLAEQGLDFLLPPYATDPHVSVLRPVMQFDTDDPVVQSAAASFNLSPAIDTLYRGVSPGGRLQHLRPQLADPLFESSPRSSCGLVSAPRHALAAPDASERQYSQLLSGLDAQVLFDGANVIPLIPVLRSRKMQTALANLPSIPFHTAGPQIPPVVVRSAHVEERTWIYVVNGSSLPVTADIQIDCPATTAVQSLVDGAAPALASIPGKRSRLRLELTGNDLWAVEIERPDTTVLETRINFSDDVLAEVRQRIDRLNANMKLAARAGGKSHVAEGRGKKGSHETQQAGWESEIRQSGSFDGDEVRQLTKTVSSVKLAWEEGRYSDCQRMLDGYWGQLLLNLPEPSSLEPPPRPKLTDKLRDKLKR